MSVSDIHPSGLSVYLVLYLSIYPSIHLSIYPSIYLSIYLPKVNRSVVPLTRAFNLIFDLNSMRCQMQNTFEVCHRLVPPPRIQLNASSVEKKTTQKTYFKIGNYGILTYIFTAGLFTQNYYLRLFFRTFLQKVKIAVIFTDIVRNDYWDGTFGRD